MKPLYLLILVALLLTALASAAAQAPPPPPPPASPDYYPKAWKEYSFASDNVRFRFPVQPTRVEATTGTAKYPSSTYSRSSFMYFDLTVTVFPPSLVQGADKKVLLNGAVNGMLDAIKYLEPKILMQQDISVDGYPGRFLKIDTNKGLLIRVKFFLAENRLYLAQAISKKGERHGFNWENDFEIPALAFLDSVHLITTK